jgi:hypothetical protein
MRPKIPVSWIVSIRRDAPSAEAAEASRPQPR